MTVSRLALVTAILISAAIPAFAAASLSPDEIKATFGTGNPIAGRTAGGMTYTLTLNANGGAQMVLSKGAKTTTTGAWRVSETGYCSKWGTKIEHCYVIVKSGDHYDVTDSTGRAVASWTP